MGAEVEARQFTREDRKRYRDKVRKDLDVLARMLTESHFDFERPMTGLEIELNLVDDDGEPAMRNAEVLAAIADSVVPDRAGSVQHRDQRRPAPAGRGRLHLLRAVGAQVAERRRPPSPGDRRATW